MHKQLFLPNDELLMYGPFKPTGTTTKVYFNILSTEGSESVCFSSLNTPMKTMACLMLNEQVGIPFGEHVSLTYWENPSSDSTPQYGYTLRYLNGEDTQTTGLEPEPQYLETTLTINVTCVQGIGVGQPLPAKQTRRILYLDDYVLPAEPTVSSFHSRSNKPSNFSPSRLSRRSSRYSTSLHHNNDTHPQRKQLEYVIEWKSEYGCRVCQPDDYEDVNTSCVDGYHMVGRVLKDGVICSGALPDSRHQESCTMPNSGKFGLTWIMIISISVGFTVFVAFLSICIFCLLRKYKKLNYQILQMENMKLTPEALQKQQDLASKSSHQLTSDSDDMQQSAVRRPKGFSQAEPVAAQIVVGKESPNSQEMQSFDPSDTSYSLTENDNTETWS